ncbi:MAG: DUF5665 domain-containing protein [Clostridiales bacterium]|nr:DUF5665 domain-containing protein [Clostridiales bacterium]
MRKGLFRYGWRVGSVPGDTPPDSEDAAQLDGGAAQSRQEQEADMEKASLVVRQIDRWIASMERLRLAEYVRYVDDRKRLFWTSFFSGVARGVGMAVGFTILGAVLVLILQDLARHNLPLIGDALAQIVSVVQKRLE